MNIKDAIEYNVGDMVAYAGVNGLILGVVISWGTSPTILTLHGGVSSSSYSNIMPVYEGYSAYTHGLMEATIQRYCARKRIGLIRIQYRAKLK